MAKQSKDTAAAAAAAIDEVKAASVQDAGKSAGRPIEMAGPKGAVVLVRGPEDGRRRGGLSFGPVDVEVDLGAIARVDMAAIMADPHLSVRPKPADADDEAAGEPTA